MLSEAQLTHLEEVLHAISPALPIEEATLEVQQTLRQTCTTLQREGTPLGCTMPDLPPSSRSKKAIETVGEEGTERHPVATGAWKCVEHVWGDRIAYGHIIRLRPRFPLEIFEHLGTLGEPDKVRQALAELPIGKMSPA